MNKVCDAYKCGMLAWGTRANPSTGRVFDLCHSHMLTALNGHTFRVKEQEENGTTDSDDRAKQRK